MFYTFNFFSRKKIKLFKSERLFQNGPWINKIKLLHCSPESNCWGHAVFPFSEAAAESLQDEGWGKQTWSRTWLECFLLCCLPISNINCAPFRTVWLGSGNHPKKNQRSIYLKSISSRMNSARIILDDALNNITIKDSHGFLLQTSSSARDLARSR